MNNLIPKTYLCAMVVGMFLLGSAALASAETPNCGMCHPEKTEGKSVHKAVKMGCLVCHLGVDASEVPHKIKPGMKRGLPAEAPELCFSCHDREKLASGRFVHEPVAGGLCLGCHDAHASRFAKLVISNDICFMCHDKEALASKRTVHPPVAGGMCTSCHGAHTARLPKLLKEAPPKACYACHKRDTFNGPVVHLPVALGLCMDCHEPHHADNRGLTKEPVGELCFGCHDAAALEKVPPHAPGRLAGCLSCHVPHAGPKPKLRR